MELILGFAALNKASGFYGIISLFTGHPIGAFQMLFNLYSIAVFPIYLLGLKTVTRVGALPSLSARLALMAATYLGDSALSVVFTVIFSRSWFANEDVAAPVPGTDTSQSATPAYELFITVATTIAVCAVRIYFGLVLIAYHKGLVRIRAREDKGTRVDSWWGRKIAKMERSATRVMATFE